ncbi:RNA polymerase sigma factor [Chryseolinea lacunae]|uniref:Sigma-70 family RNA polymerase sigma factor n=1 Tax=Chryseolinea lacunae TaxID=2801331 RepID=A0ABS1KRS5_9BACT|nr:sigma-70 family RNA polymerase sigma factor [Chryseolinea lacunae]MBL0741927.1 sigma-70 family RNA polymerase sigma factor [Chryseolinea lacunae]
MFFTRIEKKSDEELMHRVQQGDARALTALYERYSARLLRYFHRMLWKDRAKAQDFLHDLFVKVIENAERFRPEKKFSTWLYSIAHNMCKNEYRKQAFRNAAVFVADQSVENLAHARLAQQQFKVALEHALDRLDDDDKNLFTLRYDVEMSLEEIATVLECPEGTVKSRLFHLKKKLAARLGAFHPENIST